MHKYLNLLKKISNSDAIKPCIIFALVLCLAFGCCACSGLSAMHERESDASKQLPDLNPYEGINYDRSVDLYYSFFDTGSLLPKTVNVKMSSNEKPEAAILRALLSGQGSDKIHTTSIPQNCELVDVYSSENISFVTLNSELINAENYTSSRIKVAVYQIVNTLASYTSKSVQIMIDKDNDGTGDRVSYTELGFESAYDTSCDYAAPFKFEKKVIADARTSLLFGLQCLADGDLEKAVYVFADDIFAKGIGIEDMDWFNRHFKVKSFAIPYDRQSPTPKNEVYCIIQFENIDLKKEVNFEGSFFLLQPQNGLYRIPFKEFQKIAGGSK